MSARTREPAIVLSEEAGVRYLHFGSPWVQGAMRIARPFELEIDYVRDMMAWRLFLAPPAQVLQLGLGAAALTKYCWRQLPQTSVTAVESSARVIEAARRHFGLPPDDARLAVVHGDAGEYVARASSRKRFGVIQADLYDTRARGPTLDDAAFYGDCRRAIAEPGVLVLNLFGEGEAHERSLRNVRRIFRGRVLSLPAVPAGNVVVLAFAGPPMRVAWSALRRRALRLEDEGLPALQWVAALEQGQRGSSEFSV